METEKKKRRERHAPDPRKKAPRPYTPPSPHHLLQGDYIPARGWAGRMRADRIQGAVTALFSALTVMQQTAANRKNASAASPSSQQSRRTGRRTAESCWRRRGGSTNRAWGGSRRRFFSGRTAGAGACLIIKIVGTLAVCVLMGRVSMVKMILACGTVIMATL